MQENVARLFGPDDLGSWVEELALDEPERSRVAATLLGDWTMRIRTHRVLRMLLREGVWLTRGREVLRALARIESGRRQEILRVSADLRLALAPTLPGARTSGAELPAGLEELVAGGWRSTPPTVPPSGRCRGRRRASSSRRSGPGTAG
ncbi:hypothetical protein [Cellulomonas sp. ATA003]|uniref:hypothetical protein n=1 Tax=Cellulomonas sp. ATA003 TaxID=3073064 RepID=UPI002872C070|nr:hypothetical protein [Cellulomonas sp. ATA003]WNB87288.1 hypothetical protein REH70_09410 [Cellulomonas sp. ATA003]